jgi:hypothetical protein
MMNSRAAARLVFVLWLMGWSGVAWAEDAPAPPPQPTPLEALFLPAKEWMHQQSLPAFLRDTDLKIHFRTYYFNRTKPDDSINEAWAFGGWVTYKSGLLLDTFQMGATFMGSTPFYAPDDRDGTTLLKTGQQGYYVPAEAWGSLRYKDYAVLTGYRQSVNQGYINAFDNRMTPQTFEGVTLGGKIDWVQYLIGYLWSVKQRNADTFISMSEAAGAGTGSDHGVYLAGARLTPAKGLRFDVSNQYGAETFNTFFVDGEYLYELNADWKLRFGAQFTDQRAVGDALVRNAASRYWVTQHGGARVQAIYGDLTLTGAFSITGSGNKVQSPWGSFPGYMSLIDQDFNRAREKAILIGASYDASKTIAQGLSGFVNFGWGWDAIDPVTRQKAPDQAEYDFTVDYRPAYRLNVPLLWGLWQGIWVRARAAVLDQQDAKTTGYQFRIIINWDRDLI